MSAEGDGSQGRRTAHDPLGWHARAGEQAGERCREGCRSGPALSPRGPGGSGGLRAKRLVRTSLGLTSGGRASVPSSGWGSARTIRTGASALLLGCH